MGSYVGKVEYLKGGPLTIPLEVYERYQDEAPECSFYEYDMQTDEAGNVILSDLDISGNGSALFLLTLVEQMLPTTKGSADILVTWDEGGGFVGYRVADGRVRSVPVKISLREDEKRYTPHIDAAFVSAQALDAFVEDLNLRGLFGAPWTGAVYDQGKAAVVGTSWVGSAPGIGWGPVIESLAVELGLAVKLSLVEETLLT